MALSNRLLTSANYLKGFHCLADCGTDHGFLPIYAVEHQFVKKAIASDNKQGPLDNAKSNILQANLEQRIDVILADGLPYLNKEIDVVSILGMGGRLIADILDKAQKQYVKRFVLGPNSEPKILRLYLMKNNFKIIDEKMVKDKKKYYQIIVCEPGSMILNEQELEFGPMILKKQSKTFKEYVQRLIETLENALPNIVDIEETQRIKNRIEILKEVLT